MYGGDRSPLSDLNWDLESGSFGRLECGTQTGLGEMEVQGTESGITFFRVM